MKNSRKDSLYHIYKGYIFSCPLLDTDNMPCYTYIYLDKLKDICVTINGDELFKFLTENKKTITEIKKVGNKIHIIYDNATHILTHNKELITTSWKTFIKIVNNKPNLIHNFMSVPNDIISNVLEKRRVIYTNNEHNYVLHMFPKLLHGYKKDSTLEIRVYNIRDEFYKADVRIVQGKKSEYYINNSFYFISYYNFKGSDDINGKI